MLKRLIFNRQTPFWLIAFSTLLGLTLPILIQDGMFMDAMLYTSVSHNLSMGIGTFWFPQFSVHNMAGLSSFHEQPPLVFGIQSLFYKILGNSMYVERFYTFLTMCSTGMLIGLLWKEIYRDEPDLRRIGWLPLILWITIPVCFWSYSNNMHENTMGIFTLTAVILIFRSLRAGKFQIILWALSGIFIFFATLSKGLPGFFPIMVPFIYWLIIRKTTFSKTIFQTFVIVIVPVIIYAILFLIPESKESLSIYFFKRALYRINEFPTVDNRFYILYRLFTELLPQIIFVVVILFVAKLKKLKSLETGQNRELLFFICIGLSASAPLMLTLVQKGFYFVPSLPFFAIGLSMLVAPVIVSLTARINTRRPKFKLFVLLSSVLFLATITISLLQKGKTSRDKALLHDVYLIGTIVPVKTTISCPAEIWDEWELQCYLARYFNISLETDSRNNYFSLDNSLKMKDLPGYRKIDIPTLQYHLYARQQDTIKPAFDKSSAEATR